MWSSALCQIEGQTPEIGSHYDPASHHTELHSELERLRCEIARRVEDAERRCFNDRGELQVLSTQTPRKGTLANGEWRWEDMVGCWVQKTPVCAVHALPAKKRRSAMEDAPPAAKYARREMAHAGPCVRNAASKQRRSSAGRAASISSTATCKCGVPSGTTLPCTAFACSYRQHSSSSRSRTNDGWIILARSRTIPRWWTHSRPHRTGNWSTRIIRLTHHRTITPHTPRRTSPPPSPSPPILHE